MAKPKTLKHLLASTIARRKSPRLEGDDFAAVQLWLREHRVLSVQLEVVSGVGAEGSDVVARASIQWVVGGATVNAVDAQVSGRDLGPLALWEAFLEACARYETRGFDG